MRVAEASQSATNCVTVLPKESATAVGSRGQMVKQTRVLEAPQASYELQSRLVEQPAEFKDVIFLVNRQGSQVSDEPAKNNGVLRKRKWAQHYSQQQQLPQ